MDLLIYSLSTMLGLVIIGMIVFWFIQDITQKKHSVLRNYPVIELRITVNYGDSLLNTLIMPYCQHGSLTSYCNSRLSTSCDTTW
ncbi:MAG: hypothetical protein R3E36_09585 [Nitrosomonas sp.]|nr:hypothetical protein [Nitrosomonas sp.]